MKISKFKLYRERNEMDNYVQLICLGYLIMQQVMNDVDFPEVISDETLWHLHYS